MIKVNRQLLNLLTGNARINSRNHPGSIYTVVANPWGRLQMGTSEVAYPWFEIARAENGELTHTEDMKRIEAAG